MTKSVSRFARNTVDSLVTVRKLKEKGVEVYFEKENIYTLDSKGELLITIMSSLAQEESRSISENVTWGQRKRFADGKVSLPYSHFLGYRKGDNGLPEIVPEEAETVRWIYSLFLSGKTTGSIASLLTREGIPTPAGKKKWAASTVESILKNEKYKLDEQPIDEQCDCPTCRNFSRAYLRHLFKAEEILALRLAVMHNLYFYNKLTQRIRDALDAGEFAAFRAEYSTKLSERV